LDAVALYGEIAMGPVYVAFDGDNDKWAYGFMKGWKTNARTASAGLLTSSSNELPNCANALRKMTVHIIVSHLTPVHAGRKLGENLLSSQGLLFGARNRGCDERRP
jgi:hypothetical protein